MSKRWQDVDWQSLQRWERIEGRAVNVIDTGGDKPAILLVHGLGAMWQSWLPTIPALMEHHRVVAMDLPGFAHSEMPREDISITGYGRTLDALCDRLGLETVGIAGNSMGGFIGCEMAVAFPHRVRNLVLVSPATFWGETRRAKPLAALAGATRAFNAFFVSQAPMAEARPRLRYVTFRQAGIVHPERIDRALSRELIDNVGGDGFVDGVQALTNYSLRDRLPEIACPTLVVWGRRDPLVSHRDAREMEKLIPDCRVVVWDDCGHVAMLEKPDEFNELTIDFLADSVVDHQPVTR